MKTLPQPITDAERAVNAYKHELLVRVMAVIVRAGLRKLYVSANDVPEDVVEKQHRQGVASNAWNALTALEIIARVPLTLNVDELKIYGGRTCNLNPDAKGRWVAVYRLTSRNLAMTWLDRNGLASESEAQKPSLQMELINN
jgi:hypothetical protein